MHGITTQSGAFKKSIWTPVNASPLAWWDAQDSVKVTNPSDRISFLGDRSGNGKDLIQNTGSRQPLEIEADPLANNMPSIFSANNVLEFLETTTITNVKRSYIVCYYGDGTTTQHQAHSAIFAASDNSVRLTGRTNETNSWDYTGDSKNFENFNGIAGVIKQNGTDTGFTTQLPMPLTLWNVTSNVSHTKIFRVLANNNASWSSWYGGLCELIFTDGSESVDDELKIEGYLAHKWGLTGELPVDHPYKKIIP